MVSFKNLLGPKSARDKEDAETPPTGQRWLGTGELIGILFVALLFVGGLTPFTPPVARDAARISAWGMRGRDVYVALDARQAWPKADDPATNNAAFFERVIKEGVIGNDQMDSTRIGHSCAWYVLKDAPADETSEVPVLIFATARLVPVGKGRFGLQLPDKNHKRWGWGVVIHRNGSVSLVSRRYAERLTIPDHFADGRPVRYLGPQGEFGVGGVQPEFPADIDDGFGTRFWSAWTSVANIWIVLILFSAIGVCFCLVPMAVGSFAIHREWPETRVWDVWPALALLDCYPAIATMAEGGAVSFGSPEFAALIVFLLLVPAAAFGVTALVLRRYPAADRRHVLRRLGLLALGFLVLATLLIFIPAGA